MDFTSCAQSFDLFVDCYVYGSIAYLLNLILGSFIVAWFALVDDYNARQTALESDFYEQVKELLNPSTDTDELEFYEQVKELRLAVADEIIDFEFAQMLANTN